MTSRGHFQHQSFCDSVVSKMTTVDFASDFLMQLTNVIEEARNGSKVCH